jgi:phospholipase C
LSTTEIDWNNGQMLRLVGDISGDKSADIVAFGANDVWTALADGSGGYSAPRRGASGFSVAQGWTPAKHPRLLADLTGDGKADIVGFGDDGVWTAISNGDGTFQSARFVLADFNYNRGWRVENHPRFLADLTGDGRADLIGFGNAGVYVALNNGDGSFGPMTLAIGDLAIGQGWRVDRHPRIIADITGDGRADIVGFGDAGVWVALNKGNGSFAPPAYMIANFGYNQGWRTEKHVRMLADLTGDGKADLICFGDDGIWTALSNGDGSFAAPHFVSAEMGASKGWNPTLHPRMAIDLTGDGKADLVGFGIDGVWTALSNGDGSFAGPTFVMADMGTAKGWNGDNHPRFACHLDAGGRGDLIGFGDDGVWTALGTGDGGFVGPNYVLADFGKVTGVHRRVITFKYLQDKIDTFVNHRQRPIFEVKIDNPDHSFGKSTIKVALDQNNSGVAAYNYADPFVEMKLDDLSFSIYNLYFQDVVSNAVTLVMLDRQPVPMFQIKVAFETGGPIEIKVDGHTGHDIDLVYFVLKLKVGLTHRRDGFDLFGWVDDVERAAAQAEYKTMGISPQTWTAKTTFLGVKAMTTGVTREQARAKMEMALAKHFISVGVSSDVTALPDGWVSDKIEDNISGRIFDQLRTKIDKKGTRVESEARVAAREKLTPWLLGGDFKVVGYANDGQQLTIDYVIPPDQLEPFPEEPQKPLSPGALASIDHIVVLMQENRSFDHMLGYLSLDPSQGGAGRKDIEGHGPKSQIPNRINGREWLPFAINDPKFVHQTPPHGHTPVLGQISGGRMNGFAGEYARQYSTLPGLNPSDVLGFYDGKTLSVYDKLAAEFLVCDHWFAAHPGPTFPNRFYTLTGRLNRDKNNNDELDNFSGADFTPSQSKTIFDHLSAQGVGWRYYEHRYGMMRLFGKYTFDDINIVQFDDPAKGFIAAAEAGTLPPVTFIDPNFIDEPDMDDNDDAAPGSVIGGQRLVGNIVNALMKSPKWDKTLFIVTYDEHGGFFDHISPMDPDNRKTAAPVCDLDFFGCRVPTIVVSPQVARGKASHVVFDHTSIIKTIIRRFMGKNPPDMGSRVAAANDLSAVIQSKIRTDKPVIPVPPAPPRAATMQAHAQIAPSGDSDEFKDVMRFLAAQRAGQKGGGSAR